MDNLQEEFGFTQKEWEICLAVLTTLKDNPLANPDNQRFAALITKIHKTAKKQIKKESYPARKQQDIDLLKTSVIAKNALDNISFYGDEKQDSLPTYKPLSIPRNCYCCNQSYGKVHSFYHRLCPSCAEENYRNRFIQLDLSGRNVILTGGRVKIGYAAALKLLRAKANLTVTTRFPGLALAQFQKEKDYPHWRNNLEVYGLDLRNLKAVQYFIKEYITTHTCLDLLINNAAQTIRYTDAYYVPLIAQERKLSLANKDNQDFISNTTPISGPIKELLQPLDTPFNNINRFGQPVDKRLKNSWNSTLEEIPTNELLEVNLINHIAPYLLIKGLTPLLEASTFKEKFIINVTSSEGQFSYNNKTVYHPHTNMTKAALNMLTRTSAKEYAARYIYMNSVDVGWVSTGAHEVLRKKQFEKGYIPPLDSVDGAARILHPIYEILQKQAIFVGKLLKNYQVIDW